MLEVALSVVGGALIAAGLMFMAGGALGILRFPDFYTRLHAARTADGVGAIPFLLGVALVSADAGVALRVLLLALLVGAIGPTVSQILANAAHAGGLAPLAGRYTAPRPGRRSEPTQ